MSPQPSTMTKSRSLKGSEMSAGGGIIMPIDMSTELTTTSMTRNGTKTTNPMMKADFSSERTKAGTSVVRGTSSRVAGFSAPLSLTIVASSAGRVCLPMNSRSAYRRVDGLRLSHLALEVGLDAVVVHLGERRRHDEQAEEEGEPDEHLVRRDGLGAERVAGQRQHDDDLGERRREDEQGRRERQHGEQDDDRHRLARLRGPAVERHRHPTRCRRGARRRGGRRDGRGGRGEERHEQHGEGEGQPAEPAQGGRGPTHGRPSGRRRRRSRRSTASRPAPPPGWPRRGRGDGSRGAAGGRWPRGGRADDRRGRLRALRAAGWARPPRVRSRARRSARVAGWTRVSDGAAASPSKRAASTAAKSAGGSRGPCGLVRAVGLVAAVGRRAPRRRRRSRARAAARPAGR